MKEHWNSWWNEGNIVNGEIQISGVESKVKIQQEISTAYLRPSRSGKVGERNKLRFYERIGAGGLISGGISGGVRPQVSQNTRVDTTTESGGSQVRVCADPVVADGLICIQDERITLSSEYLNLIYHQRLDVDAVDFNDRESVAVDLEGEVGIAGNGHETYPIFEAFYDRDGGEW